MSRDNQLRRVRGQRRGMALIEAIIGLVLLGTVGTSLLMLLGQGRASIRTMRATEEDIDGASAALEGLVVDNRDDLSRRVGWTVAGKLALHVEEVAPSLFDVAVTRIPGGQPLLATTLYRRDSADVR
jgi:type II secretory pathway pseudopilin PulG